MNNEKRLAYLEIAFDLISKIHSDICNNGDRNDDTVDYTLAVLFKMSLLETKLKENTSNDKLQKNKKHDR